MHYLKEGPASGVTERAFKVKDSEGTGEHEATVGEALGALLDFYDVQHLFFVQKSLLLSPKEGRSYNRLVDVLKAAPQFPPYYAIEGEDFNLLKKLLEWALPPSPWWRQSAELLAFLDSAPTKMPQDAQDNHKAAVAQAEALVGK